MGCAPVGARVYKFADFRLDCDRFELLQGERSLKLERKPMELLILLATKKDRLVTRAEIAEQLWRQEVFVDTEHGINTAVRKIRQALKDDSEQPRFVQTVTEKGYRFISPLEQERELGEKDSDGPRKGESGTTLVDVFGLENEVAVRTADAARIGATLNGAAGGGSLLQRWIWFGVIAGVGALLIFAGIHKWSGGRTSIRSVAVLPLENLTGDAGQEYVADGMTDELTTMLAKNSTLRITSRTSVLQYKGVHRPLPEIARQLGVDGVLEGSIRRSGDKVHMTIQLIEALNDAHVWAESYDRDADGLVSLPKEAALDIAQRLNSGVPQQRVARYVSPEAHDAYMRGHYLWFTDHTRQSGPYFKRATELQPDYALGWSGLAIYYGASAVKGELSPAESLPQTGVAATKAMELDDSLPQAHLAMAGAQMLRWDLARAEAETLRAVELDPRFAEAHHLRAKILAAQNRHAEAIDAQLRATELDPFTRPWAMALAYLEARKFDAALKDANERLVAFPENAVLLSLTHVIYERKGMQKESVDALEKSLSIGGHEDKAKDLLSAYSAGGYRGVLRWEMKRVEDKGRSSYVSPVELADLAAKLGQREVALALLEEAYRQRATGLLWMQADPAFDSLHGDERYRSIVRRVGLPAAY